MSDEPQLPNDVLEAIHANRKIEAIKRLRKTRGLGLKEAREMVDDYTMKNAHRVVQRNPGATTGSTMLILIVVAASCVAWWYLA